MKETNTTNLQENSRANKTVKILPEALMKQLEAKIVHNLNILSKMNAVNIYSCYTASAFVAVQLKLFRLGLNARRQEVTLCMQTQLKKAGICC